MSKKTLFLLLAFVGCATLLAQPQVKYSSVRHEFGIMLWHQPEQVEFVLTNSGTSALQILEVHPDCGCTTVEYTTTPIEPGKQGYVRVRFDAEMLGHFEKQVAVRTNADTHPHYLTILGDVVKERKEYSGEYPHRIGDIYMSSDNIEFDNVQQGEQPVRTIMLYNNGKQSYEPQLMHLPKYLTATAEPAVVRPGRKGRLYVTLHSDMLKRVGLTQGNVYLSRFVGDRISRENELFVSVTMIPRIAQFVDEAGGAPVASLSTTDVRMVTKGLTKKLKGQVMLTNEGTANLDIAALQVYTPGLKVSIARSTLKPGESRPIKISVHRDFADKEGVYRILLVTNDPRNPKHIINVEVKK